MRNFSLNVNRCNIFPINSLTVENVKHGISVQFLMTFFEKNSFSYFLSSLFKCSSCSLKSFSQFLVLYVDQTGLLQLGGVPGRAYLVVMRDPVNSGYEILALSLLLSLSPACSCIPAKKLLYLAESDKKSFLKIY